MKTIPPHPLTVIFFFLCTAIGLALSAVRAKADPVTLACDPITDQTVVGLHWKEQVPTGDVTVSTTPVPAVIAGSPPLSPQTTFNAGVGRHTYYATVYTADGRESPPSNTVIVEVVAAPVPLLAPTGVRRVIQQQTQQPVQQSSVIQSTPAAQMAPLQPSAPIPGVTQK